MGGKSKTSSATSTATTVTTTDRRTVADNGAVVVGDGATANVTQTDFGAIQKAAEIAQASVIGSTQLATAANATAGQLAVRALDIGEKSFAEVKQAYQTANEQAQEVASGNRTLAIIGLGAAALAAAVGLSRVRKA